MRRQILPEITEKLPYEIREIVAVAEEIQELGQDIVWENIGDPVAKGEATPDWIKSIVKEAAGQDSSYAYSPTKGIFKTREFLAQRHNQRSETKLTANNILFFNGLGDAIGSIYQHLHSEARVIGPDPSYVSHTAAEASHAKDDPVMYRLNPSDDWQVDLDDLKAKLSENLDIVAILIINPGNPTGGVFTKKTLQGVVDLAKEYDCFIIADEIYDGLRFPDSPDSRITDVLGSVPAVVMHGMSKEVPWPGARCGWLEFYNTDTDLQFEQFRKRLIDTKMHEVCSTTLPQMVLPEILSDSRWLPYLKERSLMYHQRSLQLIEALSGINGVTVVQPAGAYYVSVLFDNNIFSGGKTLDIDNPEIQSIISPILPDATPDERFVYFLLAAEGICVVPLSTGFHSRLFGFRITLLESNEEVFADTLTRLRRAIETYLQS